MSRRNFEAVVMDTVYAVIHVEYVFIAHILNSISPFYDHVCNCLCHLIVASGGVISRTCNFGVISRTFLKKVNFEILFVHINFCSCHFQRTGFKLLEPVVRTGLPLIIKKLEDFV